VLTSHGLHYVLLIALAVVVAAGLLVEEVERGSNKAFQTVGDGLWWALVTVTTVGYGDKTPITPVGRGIAVVLMLAGIGLFGVLAATLASYFIRQEGRTDVEPKIDEVIRRLDRIEQQLSSGSMPDQPPERGSPPDGRQG
jgi:voltage-gated potassium channel